MESRGLWLSSFFLTSQHSKSKVYPDEKRIHSPLCQKNMRCFVVVVPDVLTVDVCGVAQERRSYFHLHFLIMTVECADMPICFTGTERSGF